MLNLATFSSLLEATAVAIAVVFGIIQVRQIRQERRRKAAYTLMRSLQTPEMLRALMILDSLPDDNSAQQIKEHFSGAPVDLQILFGTWESLGILVCRNEVPIDLVDDFYSGSIVHSWAKLKPIALEVRKKTERETRWEFFQWLAERMIERERKTEPIPAYIEHRDWIPQKA